MSPVKTERNKTTQLAFESYDELIQNAFKWILFKREVVWILKLFLVVSCLFCFLKRRFFGEIVDGLMLPFSISCQG